MEILQLQSWTKHSGVSRFAEPSSICGFALAAAFVEFDREMNDTKEDITMCLLCKKLKMRTNVGFTK